MTNLPPPDFPSGTTELDVVLRRVTESAQSLSGATGSAIAIRNGNDRNGEQVLCVARSGENAPPLGSRLDANSGISGECLLTGRVLHSNDTNADHRVDPEVCRQLGLRSIIVLPVRGKKRIAGVLEVFSTQPHAFTREHIDSLKRLTEMIEMACGSKPDDGLDGLVRQGFRAIEPTARSFSWRNRLRFPLSFLKNRRSYWIAGGGLASLILVALISIEAFHSSANRDDSRQAAQSTVNPSPPETAEILLQSAAGSGDRQTKRARHVVNNNENEHGGLEKASKIEVLASNGKPATHESVASEMSSTVSGHSQAGEDLNSDQAPSLPLAENSTDPGGLFGASAMMPRLSPAISQGMTGGILDHRVNPVYPPGALAMKLEGQVVLAAVVTKTGEVRDVRLVKGSPILARAAMDAVKQWHYKPYRLNGEPLESQTEITVQFHAK
jgi:TonB family protein